MTIPRVQGWWESIAQPLQQIGDAVADWKNPHRQTQKEVMRKLALDPNYANQLSELAQDNPEMIERLGLGKILPTLQQAPVSPERRVKNVQARSAERTDQVEELLAPFELLQNPEVFADVQRKRWGLNTKKEEELVDLQISGQKLNQQLGHVQLLSANNVLTEQRADQEIGNLAADYLKKIKPQDNLYVLWKTGKMPPEAKAMMMRSKEFAGRYESDVDIYYNDQRLALERARAEREKSGSRMDFNEFFMRRSAMNAESLSEALGMNLDVVFNLVKGGTPLSAYVKQAEDSGIKTPAQLAQLRNQNPEQANQIEFGMRLARQDKVKRDKELGRINSVVNRAFAEFQKAANDTQNDKGSPMYEANAITNYNDAVTEYNSMLLGDESPKPLLEKQSKGWIFKTEHGSHVMTPREMGSVSSIPMVTASANPWETAYQQSKKANSSLTKEAYAANAKRQLPAKAAEIDAWLRQ